MTLAAIVGAPCAVALVVVLAASPYGNWNGACGYIDKSGRMAIPPRFQSAREFSYGLAAVCIHGKWGYIDTKGNVVIPPRFTYAVEFVDDVAGVKIAGRTCVIDRTGRIITDGEFRSKAAWFQKDAAIRTMLDDTRPLRGLDIHVRLETDYASTPRPARVGKKIGYADPDGKVVISPRFTQGMPFHEGLAAAATGWPPAYGYIDPTGDYVVQPQFDTAGGFRDGMGQIEYRSTGRRAIGFIDRTGKVVIAPRFRWAGNFSEGLAWVRTGDGNDDVAFIDKSGRVVLTPDVQGTRGGFSNGLAAVYVRGTEDRLEHIGAWIVLLAWRLWPF